MKLLRSKSEETAQSVRLKPGDMIEALETAMEQFYVPAMKEFARQEIRDQLEAMKSQVLIGEVERQMQYLRLLIELQQTLQLDLTARIEAVLANLHRLMGYDERR